MDGNLKLRQKADKRNEDCYLERTKTTKMRPKKWRTHFTSRIICATKFVLKATTVNGKFSFMQVESKLTKDVQYSFNKTDGITRITAATVTNQITFVKTLDTISFNQLKSITAASRCLISPHTQHFQYLISGF